MAIEFVCPACGGTLRVSDESAGRVVRCGGCMTMLRVPAAEVDPSAPASPFDADDPSAPASAPPERRPRRARDRDAPEPAPDPGGPRRPRRRRPPDPPPAPAGRGIFFWLVVTGGVMFLGAVGCCGGLFLLTPGPQWHKHESKGGGFRVDLPAPRHDIDRVGGVLLKQERGAESEGTILARKLEEFAVAYRDLTPQELQKGEQKVLDAEVEKLKSSRAVRGVRRTDPINVNGCPGREVEFVSANGGTYVARVVVADTRLYRALAGGQLARPGNANVRRFLDSFEITDARLLAGAKRREAQAKFAAEKLRRDAERAKEDEDRAADKAAETAAKEKAHRERVKEEDEEFRNEPYDGPPVPEARAAGAGADAHVFSFEKGQGGGVVARVGNWPLVRPGVPGPGVRGKAAYLVPESQPAAFGLGPGEGDVLKKTLGAPGGYTLAGWVRVRHAPVAVFSLAPGDEPNEPLAELTVGRTIVSARLAGPGRLLGLAHPWDRDGGWHHVALVRDNRAARDNVRLYLDGKLVASGAVGAVEWPARARVVMGWVNRPPDPDWPGPPDADGKPAPPADGQIVGAIDECVLVGRPLTDSEVRVLCGKEKPRPAEPPLPVAPPPREKP